MEQKNISKPKKPVYKKWWFWVIIAVLIIGIGANMGAGEENTPNDKPTTSQSNDTSKDDDNAEKDEAKQEESQKEEMPILKGSQAYDIILSIEEKTGIEKPETTYNDDGLVWMATNSAYSYTVESNKKHEVAYARFMVLNGGDSAFLGFCASMPYDTAESQKAMDWVNQNVGQEASTTIGDATFTLSNGNQGPILTITAKGYDEYSLNKMANAE